VQKKRTCSQAPSDCSSSGSQESFIRLCLSNASREVCASSLNLSASKNQISLPDNTGIQDSSERIMSKLQVGEPGLDSRQGKKIFLFSIESGSHLVSSAMGTGASVSRN
jgi:hypothetical protein